MNTRSYRGWRAFSLAMVLLLVFIPLFPNPALGKATQKSGNTQPGGSFSIPAAALAASSTLPAGVPPLPGAARLLGDPQPAKPDLGEWFHWFPINASLPVIKGVPGGAVTALWRADGHLDLFMTGTDGAVWSNWWESAKGWQNWFLIHPEVKMSPGARVTAQWRGGTHLDLFVTGTDGAVWSTWWEAQAGWQAWFIIHPEVKANPGATVTALISPANGNHIDLFMSGSDGTVWSTWWEPDVGWQNWFGIHTEVKMNPGAAVSALWRGTGHLDLFAAGADGAVWSTWWEFNPGWQAWFLIHPEIKMFPGAQVSALLRGSDHIDLFVTGTDGAVWSTWWEPAPGWQSWFLIHPEVKMQPGAPVTAVWRSNFGHLDLFATGTDGAVWSTWWEPGNVWQAWFLIHPEIKMDPGSPVTALWRGGDHLDLFLTGSDGAVWTAWWESQQNWQGWYLIVPPVDPPKAYPGAQITALWRDAQHLDLFMTDLGGVVWSAWWEPGRGWQPWFAIHPEVHMHPGAPVTALWRAPLHLDLFATGMDGEVWSTWWEPGPGWQSWFAVHPEVHMFPGAAVTALWRDPQHLDLFASGLDGAVWSTWWEPGPGWQSWFQIHPEVKMQPGVTVTAQWRGQHLDLFVTGTDGAVWSAWWEAGPGWQSWFQIHPEVKMQPGAPVTAQLRPSDHIDLFVTGTDGAVWSTWWEPGKNWQSWFLIHPEVKASPGAQVSAVWRSNFTHLDLFMSGGDGTVWSTWWEGQPGWQPWFSIYPNEVKAASGAPVTALWRGGSHLDLFVSGPDGTVWSTYFQFSDQDSDQDGLSDAFERTLCTDPNNPDSDHDGLLDGWELYGIRFPDGDFVDLPAMGANPCHKDIFVQYDYERGARAEPGVWPTVINLFAQHGITLHMTENERPRNGVVSNTNAETEAVKMDGMGNYFFPPKLNWTHHYIFSNHNPGNSSTWYYVTINVNTFNCPLDAADPQNDLRCRQMTDATGKVIATRSADDQVYRIVHELGHNMGMGHGGNAGNNQQSRNGDYVTYDPNWDNTNDKPNYISVMNYGYSFEGNLCFNPTTKEFLKTITYLGWPIPELDEGHLEEAGGRFALALQAQSCPGLASGYVPVFMYTCTTGDGTQYLIASDGRQALARAKKGEDWVTSGLPSLPNGIDWNCASGIQGGTVSANINGDSSGDWFGSGPADQHLSAPLDWAEIPYQPGSSCSVLQDTKNFPQAYRDRIGRPDCKISSATGPSGPQDAASPSLDHPLDFIPQPHFDTIGDTHSSLPNLELCDGIDNDGDGQVDEGCADSDGDGKIDSLDNCPLTANPDQADADANGLGDACQMPQVLDLALTSQGDQVSFSWQVSTPDVLGFNVYRIGPGQGDAQFLGSGYPSTRALSFSDQPAEKGEYHYIVAPLNRMGQEGAPAGLDAEATGVKRLWLPVMTR